MVVIQSPDIRSALHAASSTLRHLSVPRAAASRRFSQRASTSFSSVKSPSLSSSAAKAAVRVRVRAFSTDSNVCGADKVANKPAICTADELHYVSVTNSDWRLALWRYAPSPQVGSLSPLPQLFFSFLLTEVIFRENVFLGNKQGAFIF